MYPYNFFKGLGSQASVNPLVPVVIIVLSCWMCGLSFAITMAPDDTTRSSGDSTIVKPAVDPNDDGWYDMSSFLDKPYGFLPMLSPITEPAVGYGAWGGPTFISEPSGKSKAGWGRPNITFVGGAWTENHTWAAIGEDTRQWLGERLQTQLDAVYASVNLKFHGIGENSLLKDHPLSYNLTPLVAMVKARYRIGESCFWVGLGYSWAKTVTEIDIPANSAGIGDIRLDSKIGALLPLVAFDTRDNIWTPLSGTNVQLSARLGAKALGGDGNFQMAYLTVMQFVSPIPTLTVGLRGDGTMSFGDVPFYVYPSLGIRGAPAMRYQGEDIAQGELEVRWQFWKRISAVGFCGYGVAWNDLEYFDNMVHVFTKGLGLRYELARKYGLHAGVDVAWAPDGAAVYVVFGNAWLWK